MSRSPPCRKTLIPTEEILGRRAGYIERCKSGSEGGLRHEVVSVIVVRGVRPRHNPLSHQRYPTEMCGKVTTRTAPPDHGPTAHRLASHAGGDDVSVITKTEMGLGWMVWRTEGNAR